MYGYALCVYMYCVASDAASKEACIVVVCGYAWHLYYASCLLLLAVEPPDVKQWCLGLLYLQFAVPGIICLQAARARRLVGCSRS